MTALDLGGMFARARLEVFSHLEDSPADALRRIYGPDVRATRMLAVDTDGAYLDGWVALLPTGTGWGGVYVEDSPLLRTWERSPLGERVSWLENAVRAALVTDCADLIGVAQDCVQAIGRSSTAWDLRLDTSMLGWKNNRSIPRYAHGWLLRHTLNQMPEYATDPDALWTLLALAAGDAAEQARTQVATLDNLMVNRDHQADAVTLMTSLLREQTGLEFDNEALVRRSAAPTNLLAYPRPTWPEQALALLDEAGLLTPPSTPAPAPAPQSVARAPDFDGFHPAA